MSTPTRAKSLGYLPNDVPPIGQILLLGLQHALTMFPATVLVALLVGFHVSTVLLASGVATVLAFVGKLTGVVQSIPTAVSGGLAIYLFGVIGMQGIALMMSEKVDLFDPRQLGVGATILLVVGVGGHIGYPGGFLPVPLFKGIFPNGWPAIATAAVLGILLNAIFLIFKPRKA